VAHNPNARRDRGRADSALNFDLSVEIQRPPTAVLAVLADIQNYEPIPLDARVKMTKHPSTATRVGTRWDERVKIAPGWWMSIESVVTDIQPPSLLGMDFHGAWLYGHLAYTITPSPEGATLHQRETVHLRWPLRWFSTRVERRLRAQLSRRLAELRDLLEADLRSRRSP
jgi:uncharacterized protein YndB with AHSA1/START domain